jgi:ppGpp synthetase/RelA/SpoT-type nucleotidyltranferase
LPTEFEIRFAAVASELKLLDERVTSILSSIAEEEDGSFESRIKNVDSAFEKFVLGRYAAPLAGCEDLYGCTLILKVTPTGVTRDKLEELLVEDFQIKEIRTARNADPNAFVYDDLHYLLQLRDKPTLLNKDLLRWIFELQVKSFLQHGWGKSTRALTYKPTVETWRANRVVAQTRALIEMADGALVHGSDFLPQTEDRPNVAIDTRSRLVAAVEKWWKRSDLPENRRRLGIFIFDFIHLASLSVEQFETLLGTPRARELPQKLALNVHQAILVLLIEERNDVLIRNLRSRKRFALISQSMEDNSPRCKAFPNDIRVTF